MLPHQELFALRQLETLDVSGTLQPEWSVKGLLNLLWPSPLLLSCVAIQFLPGDFNVMYKAELIPTFFHMVPYDSSNYNIPQTQSLFSPNIHVEPYINAMP